MRILAIEPFLGGSHKLFLEGYRRFSAHTLDIIGLPARKWKWRMRGAAIHFAEQLAGKWEQYDLLLASDFLSLADLVGLAPAPLANLPKAVYFHENQLTYPFRHESERDYQYAFTNITTCLAADQVIFNSHFHRNEFLSAIGPFLKRMPDFRPTHTIETIRQKSIVLHFGLDLEPLTKTQRPQRAGPATILWNHRWEFDKAPELFFNTLFQLKRAGIDFRLAVAGERFPRAPEIFSRAETELADRIIHFGYLESRADYAALLRQCDLICSTAIHEFFGVSVLEAIGAGCYPLLPNRLSYPELIPAPRHPTHLYNSDAEFPKKLRAAIENIKHIRSQNLAALAAPFAWPRLAPHYDQTFTTLSSIAGKDSFLTQSH